MNTQKISITAFSSISPLGNNANAIWKKYLDNQHCFSKRYLDQYETSVGALEPESKQIVADLRESDTKYKFLDDSVLFALAASRKAIEQAGWKARGKPQAIPAGPRKGTLVVYVTGPDHITLELMQANE